MTTYVAVRCSGGWLSGLGWAGLAVLFCAGLPYLVLFVLLRGGVVADRHVVRREQRLWPSVTALISVLVGLALLWRLGEMCIRDSTATKALDRVHADNSSHGTS